MTFSHPPGEANADDTPAAHPKICDYEGSAYRTDFWTQERSYEDEVERVVRETIGTAAPGGGYIISSSKSIHPGCKPENYIAMVNAAHKYGTYG